MSLAPPNSGAPVLSRAMRIVVASASAAAGTVSLTPSGPSTTPPAALMVAEPVLAAGASGELPPQALSRANPVNRIAV